MKVAFQEEGASRGPARAGVLVPQNAVKERDGKQYVFLLGDGVVERRAVAMAGERGKDILVTSGIVGGDRVILNAPPGLVEGVRAKEKGE